MSQACKSPKNFTATENLLAFRRVKLTSGSGTAVEYADQSDSSNYIGITFENVDAGETIAVILKGMQETVKATASEAFVVGATLYAANDGKVSDTSSGNAIGTALEAASGNNSVVEVFLDNGSAAHTFPRSSIVQEDAVVYPIPIGSQFVVWDAPSTFQPATPANDDLGVIDNTFATGAPSLETGDLKAAGATSRKTRFQFPVPSEYTPGETITLRVNAGMKTTISDTTATLDAECVRQAAPSVDIVGTAAQSINSLTNADKDFTITPTNVVVGDVLDVVLTVAVNDGATGTAVIGKIYSVDLLLDIKG